MVIRKSEFIKAITTTRKESYCVMRHTVRSAIVEAVTSDETLGECNRILATNYRHCQENLCTRHSYSIEMF